MAWSMSRRAAEEEKDTERLEFFSDAVIAISITLLVLDIKVPHGLTDHTSLLGALRTQWHSFLSFAVSFTFIGLFWATHHNMFRYIKRTNHVLLLLNTLFLMFVALIPFSTALLGEYLGGGHQRDAMLFYIGTYLGASFFFNLVWRYAAKQRRLLARDTDAALVKTMTGEYSVTLICYLMAFGLAFFSVGASLVPIVLLVIFYVFPRPDERRKADDGKTGGAGM